MRQNIFQLNNMKIAMSYNSVSKAHEGMEHYLEANLNYQHACDSLGIPFPAELPELASTYNNIARICQKTNIPLSTLGYYRKTLRNLTKADRKNVPILAPTCDHIGQIYNNLAKYQEVIICYRQVIETAGTSLLQDNIKLGQYKKCLSNCNTTDAPQTVAPATLTPRTFALATLAPHGQLFPNGSCSRDTCSPHSCSPMSLGICYAFFCLEVKVN